MKGRKPWLGLATISGLGIMLLGEGAIDMLGRLLVIPFTPVDFRTTES